MKLIWQIEPPDVLRFRTFLDENRNNRFVQNRVRKNVEGKIPNISKPVFWKTMLGCLLTTQQRSGPDSPVSRLLSSRPFPLSYLQCRRTQHLETFIHKTITDFRGIRMGKTIAREAVQNFQWLEAGGWTTIFEVINGLHKNKGSQHERRAARTIITHLTGFGPKQARNLLQDLGLTKYEIPLDSRIIKWLNKFGFPLHLSAGGLSDPDYYEFVLDGLQHLCAEVNILPCVADAIIFSSYDEGKEWTHDVLS